MHNRLRFLPSTVGLQMLQLKPALIKEYLPSFVSSRHLSPAIKQKVFAASDLTTRLQLVRQWCPQVVDPLYKHQAREDSTSIDARSLSPAHFGYLLNKKPSVSQQLALLSSDQMSGFKRALLWNNPELVQALEQEAQHNPAALELLQNLAINPQYHLKRQSLAQLLWNQDHETTEALLQAAIEEGLPIGPKEIEALQLGESLNLKGQSWLQRLFSQGKAWWLAAEYLPGGLEGLGQAVTHLESTQQTYFEKRSRLSRWSAAQWEESDPSFDPTEGLFDVEKEQVFQEANALSNIPTGIVAAAVVHYQQYPLLIRLAADYANLGMALVYIAKHLPSRVVKKLFHHLRESMTPYSQDYLVEAIQGYLDNPHFQAKVLNLAVAAINKSQRIDEVVALQVIAHRNCTFEAFTAFYNHATQNYAPLSSVKKSFWIDVWQDNPVIEQKLIKQMWLNGSKGLRQEMSQHPGFSWDKLLQESLPPNFKTLYLLKHPQFNQETLELLCRSLPSVLQHPTEGLHEVVEALYYHPLSNASIRRIIKNALD